MATISMRPATIASRGTISGSVDLTGVTAVVGLIMPAAGTWTAAGATVQGSPDGTTFYDLYSGMPANELYFNVKPGTVVAIDPNRLRGFKAIKLRSGTAAAPVMQNAACQFGVIVES